MATQGLAYPDSAPFPRIEHVAIWTRDLESMRVFYTTVLGGLSGQLYENPTTGLKSYFVSFGAGPRVELMHMPGRAPQGPAALGFAHLAFSLGSRSAVDDAVAGLRTQGVHIESAPRVTGDGYYEAVVLDPECNRVELTA